MSSNTLIHPADLMIIRGHLANCDGQFTVSQGYNREKLFKLARSFDGLYDVTYQTFDESGKIAVNNVYTLTDKGWYKNDAKDVITCERSSAKRGKTSLSDLGPMVTKLITSVLTDLYPGETHTHAAALSQDEKDERKRASLKGELDGLRAALVALESAGIKPDALSVTSLTKRVKALESSIANVGKKRNKKDETSPVTPVTPIEIDATSQAQAIAESTAARDIARSKNPHKKH